MQIRQLVAVLALLSMSGGSALAGNRHHVIIDGGMVHLRGALTEAACSVSTESAHQIIDMGQFRSNQFGDLGSFASPVEFNIRLTECSTAVSNTVGVAFYGVTDGKDPQVLKAGEGENAATGVGLALFDRNGDIIPPNTPPRTGMALHEGENILRFMARYRATSRQVVAGNADASTWFALTYQ
ncbi:MULTISPECIES: fimbrial protein [Serratia]|uniref:fimbrial protein n=2 Tax=Serratia TaxID=613 RepID=UPI00114F4E8D|nr:MULTISPECIES: fimbrial protein [Serratia]EJC2626083.1 fimbrial protein [Escherichia coli]MBH2616208.1 fimbrial protein [Serratia ureilytica]MBH3062315.1 fimbrial protein [Serratia ureilytica]MBH3094415.1 fimbrial protein [Serratia ureilytica]MBH3143147.1 fimbrial protein [Serratia ureilytica]